MWSVDAASHLNDLGPPARQPCHIAGRDSDDDDRKTKDRQTDGRTDGPMDGWMDDQLQLLKPLSSR